jgi:hypothetical protein
MGHARKEGGHDPEGADAEAMGGFYGLVEIFDVVQADGREFGELGVAFKRSKGLGGGGAKGDCFILEEAAEAETHGGILG